MLTITITGGTELFDESNNEFIKAKNQTLQLEHSLVSLSKWEARWHKPFMDSKEKSRDETLDYVRCMTITQNVEPQAYLSISSDQFKKIRDYIDDPMSATEVYDTPTNTVHGRLSGDTITAELIYYWMIELGIPLECQKWHLNRLITLIRLINKKREPAKKMNATEQRQMYSRVNAARRKKHNTKG